MSTALTRGLPAAVVAAVLYGLSPVVQAAVARAAPAGRGLGLGLLVQLARRPLWLAGLGCELFAFLFEVYAFSAAPVALVAPVLAMDMVVLALVARRTLAERLHREGVLGIAAMVTAVGLIALSFGEESQSGLGTPATDVEMLLFAAGGGLAAGAGAWAGQRAGRRGDPRGAALWFGLSAGIAYAVATLATRQLGLLLHDHELWRVLLTPTPYVLAVSSVVALSVLQRGLQSGAAVLTFPVTSGVSAFAPVILGLTLLGEDTPSGSDQIVFVVALVLTAAGVILLGRDRAAAEEAIERRLGGQDGTVEPSGPPDPPDVVGSADPRRPDALGGNRDGDGDGEGEGEGEGEGTNRDGRAAEPADAERL